MTRDEIPRVALPVLLRLLRGLPIPRKLGLLERLFGAKLSRQGIAWYQCSNGVIWKLDGRDATHRWILYGDFEGPRQMRWVRNWLKDGGVVVDSGANIGQILLYLAPIPGVSVLALEPMPSQADWLRSCLEIQRGWNVGVVQSALAAQQKSVALQFDGARSTIRTDWYQGKQFERIEAPADTLDHILAERKIGKVRLWKLDVEGAELDVLNGAIGCLQSHSIDAILVEIHHSNFSGVAKLLGQYGYTLHVLRSTGDLQDVDTYLESARNYIATPGRR